MNKLSLERNVSSQETCDFNLQNCSSNQKMTQWTFFENHVGYGFFYRVLMFPNKIGMVTEGMGYFCKISLF